MKRSLLAAVAIAASFMINAAHASVEELRDYTDKSITCDKDDIKERMARMIENSAYGRLRGVHLLYIKGEPVEVSRRKDELKCRIDVRTSDPTEPFKGIFSYHNEDGVALVGFKPD